MPEGQHPGQQKSTYISLLVINLNSCECTVITEANTDEWINTAIRSRAVFFGDSLLRWRNPRSSFLLHQPEQFRGCLSFQGSGQSEESAGVKYKNEALFTVWNTQRQASAPIRPVRAVQDRTEIPMSTAAMKFSWQSPVWSEGLYALAMGTCSGCNALFKNTHSIQASGDTFCYSVRSSKCNSAEEETFFASWWSRARGRPGR